MSTALANLFKSHFGFAPEFIVPIAAHASGRRIFRLSAQGKSAIGVHNRNREENRAFVGFAQHFHAKKLPVPAILIADLVNDLYLQEDLGDCTLASIIALESATQASPHLFTLLEKCVRTLVQFQLDAGVSLDYSLCHPVQNHSRDALLWDLHYFRDHFLQRTNIPFDSQLLEQDLQRLATFLYRREWSDFLYRDLSARNILIKAEEPYFIDFDRGRKGPFLYDLARLIFQSKLELSPKQHQSLEQLYLAEFAARGRNETDTFNTYYPSFVLVQFLHRLGAYGRFGFGLGQKHFIESIAGTVRHLRSFIRDWSERDHYPELSKVLRLLCAVPLEQSAEQISLALRSEKLLTVTLTSFAYKHGMPQFLQSAGSLSGGGFVFDCRSLPNPGREECYRCLTGRDLEVVEYLETYPEVLTFKGHVWGLVEAAVKNFLERDFSELIVSFGCTGGQHRSVYFVEQLARQLSERFPVRVIVSHRELERKA